MPALSQISTTAPFTRVEEKLLRTQFGDECDACCARTGSRVIGVSMNTGGELD